MRFYLDTEFWEDGPSRPIQLISLSLVSEVGDELYLINEDFDWGKCTSQWLIDNVLTEINRPEGSRLPFSQLGAAVANWVWRTSAGKPPQFWGYYADYDWVVFCQLFGSMLNLPEGFPKFCMDIKQLCMMLGNPTLPKQGVGEHNALQDARWNRHAWEFLAMIAAGRIRELILSFMYGDS